VKKKFDDYKIIIDSGFFKMPGPGDITGDSQITAGAISELTLLGTITGPASIARAMVYKNGEKNPGSLPSINSAMMWAMMYTGTNWWA